MAEAFWDVSKEIPLLEAIPKWKRAMENRVRWLPNVKQTWKLLPMDIRYAIDPEIVERSRRQRMLERERKSSGISHNVGTVVQSQKRRSKKPGHPAPTTGPPASILVPT